MQIELKKMKRNMTDSQISLIELANTLNFN
jgi:hypothetical protein